MCHHRQRKDMRMTTKGVKSLKEGKGLTADEVDTILAKEFGI